MRVVPDTNVLVSGLLWDGLPNQVLSMAATGSLSLCGTEETFAEFQRVVKYTKFLTRLRLHLSSARMLESQCRRLVRIYAGTKVPQLSCPGLPDHHDLMFLEAAAAWRAPIVVSGDPHLLGLLRCGKVDVLTCSQLVVLLRKVQGP
jgi:putative PIN family toxin of toxin-antitoxin system